MIRGAAAHNSKVRELVYVCAVLPQAGESAGSLMAEDPTPSQIGDIIVASDDGTGTLDPDGARRILFNDVPAETSAPILEALGPHRLGTFVESPEGLGPSTYMLTTEEIVFSPELQRRMAASATKTVEVEAGHIPLPSKPGDVAQAIGAAAA